MRPPPGRFALRWRLAAALLLAGLTAGTGRASEAIPDVTEATPGGPAGAKAGAGGVAPRSPSVAAVSGGGASRPSAAPLPEQDGWPAVGRLDVAGRPDFCSAVLIAPDLVLTAAHCLHRHAGGPVVPADLTFRAGGEGLPAAGHGRALMMHPAYAAQPPGLARYAVDLALVRLEAPLEIAPLPLGRAEVGDRAALVSYRNGRGEEAVHQPDCPVLQATEGLLALGCAVSGGASGGAVLAGGSLAGLLVARSSSATQGAFALAVRVEEGLPALGAAWTAAGE